MVGCGVEIEGGSGSAGVGPRRIGNVSERVFIVYGGLWIGGKRVDQLVNSCMENEILVLLV